MARFFKRYTEAEFRKLVVGGAFGALLTDERILSGQLQRDHPVMKKALKDLEKITFDFENIESSKTGSAITSVGPDAIAFAGINTLPNGLTYCGMIAGGDWETPVYFIIYHDGKDFRGYVPEVGNTFNPKTRSAYGNEEFDDDDLDEAEIETLEETIEKERELVRLDLPAMLANIQDRIKEKI